MIEIREATLGDFGQINNHLTDADLEEFKISAGLFYPTSSDSVSVLYNQIQMLIADTNVGVFVACEGERVLSIGGIYGQVVWLLNTTASREGLEYALARRIRDKLRTLVASGHIVFNYVYTGHYRAIEFLKFCDAKFYNEIEVKGGFLIRFEIEGESYV